jgi:hypothetical protein
VFVAVVEKKAITLVIVPKQEEETKATNRIRADADEAEAAHETATYVHSLFILNLPSSFNSRSISKIQICLFLANR